MRPELARFLDATTPLETRWGPVVVQAAALTEASDGDLVVHVGAPLTRERPTVRVHSACIFSEVFGHDFCDCYEQLDLAMQELARQGDGLLFYLRYDGRGSGLAAKVAATRLELRGVDTYDSRRALDLPGDGRDFGPVADWLARHGIDAVTLLSNNPDKRQALESRGIDVAARPILVADPNADVARLYRTKAERFGHDIPPSVYQDDHGQLSMFEPGPTRNDPSRPTPPVQPPHDDSP